MEILIIILIVVLIIGIAVYIVASNKKKTEREKYYTAAGNILKEDFLNYLLQNPMGTSENLHEPNAQKTMIYIKSLNSKQKKQYVFDPEKRILIGRDKDESNIYLNEAFVSQYHCCIFSDGSRVYLSDMNSSNGTILKRGLFKKYYIYNQAVIELKSGDKITIGSNTFKVILFYYDMVLM